MLVSAFAWNDRWWLWSPKLFGFTPSLFGTWVLWMFITHIGNISRRKLLEQILESYESPNVSRKHQCCPSTCWIKLLSAKINKCLSPSHSQFYTIQGFQTPFLPTKSSLLEEETPLWGQELLESATVFSEVLLRSPVNSLPPLFAWWNNQNICIF